MAKFDIFSMKFSRLYQLYLAKVAKKGRSRQELDRVLMHFCSLSRRQLSGWKRQGSVGEFVRRIYHSPALESVGGSICGVKIEDIRRPDMKAVRRLDKLADELAKGKSLEKIMNR